MYADLQICKDNQVIWWRNEKARPKSFNAVSHNHVQS